MPKAQSKATPPRIGRGGCRVEETLLWQHCLQAHGLTPSRRELLIALENPEPLQLLRHEYLYFCTSKAAVVNSVPQRLVADP